MEENKEIVAENIEEVATPQKQDITETQAFSKRLKEMTSKAVLEATSSLKDQVQKLENERQDQEFKSNKGLFDVYSLMREEILKSAEEKGTNIKTAFAEVFPNRAEEVLQQIYSKAKMDALNELKDNINSNPGSLSGASASTKIDYSNLDEDELEEMIKKAKSGALRSK